MLGGSPPGGIQALRLLAWARIPSRVSGKSHETREPFDCDAVCRDMKSGEFRDESRSVRGCTRVDLAPVEWDVSAAQIRVGYMGRAPQPGLTEEAGLRVNPKKPLESPEDGCPGGWYRSRFAWSLDPYIRIRAEGGQRVSNPLLEQCDDELILQLVNIYEREQERCHAHRLEAMAK